jgi:hypothetical protein
MLEFIVLGIIPGTHYQITFNWILAAASLILIIIKARTFVRKRNVIFIKLFTRLHRA